MRWVWGKAKNGAIPHPLICHMLDTAHVALRLLDVALPGSFLDALHKGPVERAVRLLAVAFIAGAHDVGKCSCWQMKRQDLLPGDAPPGLPDVLWESLSRRVQHGLMTDVHLRQWLMQRFRLRLEIAGLLAETVGGHHGTFFDDISRRLLRNPAGEGAMLGGPGWSTLRDEHLEELARLLGDPDLAGWEIDVPGAVLLAGLTAVSDWIASDESKFPYAGSDVDLDAYVKRSREQAKEAVDALGWGRWQPAGRSLPELLPKQAKPRPAQETVMALAAEGMFDRPGLVIVEDAMGGGKTEIAQYAVAEWVRRLGLSGFFFALPTQATSNQMLDRLQMFLGLHSAADTLLHLVHGAAGLNEEFLTLLKRGDPRTREPITPAGVYTDTGRKDGVDVAASRWFTARWRGLLAPCGVGTVDQILRAGLRTRHNAVLHFGLAGKAVVIDEVHAHDLYMSTVLDRVLEWLGRYGVPVILLSATLPARRRVELLEAWQRGAGQPGPSSPAEGRLPYPLISWATAAQAKAVPVEAGDSDRIVMLDFEHACDTPGRLAAWLAEDTADGGCVAVICNTVGRAQSLYNALRAAGVPKRQLILFHARFPHARRHELEREVLGRFGRKGRRPKTRRIVVATQVIEQSLDLDFDFMVTDHTAVDLLLQRAGRLHRHDRKNRPARYVEPRLAITGITSTKPLSFPFGSDIVYGSRVLIASWYAIRQRRQVSLPGDIRTLTEAVYGDDTPKLLPADVDAYAQAVKEEAQERERQERLADQRCVPEPDVQRLYRMTELQPDEVEDSELTRLGLPSVDVVLLEETEGGLVRPVTGGEAFDLRKAPTRRQQRELVLSSLAVATPRALFAELAEQEPEPAWQWSPWLRGSRALVLRRGRAQTGRCQVTYDPILGLRATTPFSA